MNDDFEYTELTYKEKQIAAEAKRLADLKILDFNFRIRKVPLDAQNAS